MKGQKRRDSATPGIVTFQFASPWVNFINCYAPYTSFLGLVLNFYTSKKLLESWVLGCSAKGANKFMKLTPGHK